MKSEPVPMFSLHVRSTGLDWETWIELSWYLFLFFNPQREKRNSKKETEVERYTFFVLKDNSPLLQVQVWFRSLERNIFTGSLINQANLTINGFLNRLDSSLKIQSSSIIFKHSDTAKPPPQQLRPNQFLAIRGNVKSWVSLELALGAEREWDALETRRW